MGILYFYPFLGLLLTLLALVVAATRVMVGIHYIGDIVVGMIVGVLVGWGTILVLTGLSLIP
jgi:undecaprenyl-diphosphatase